jgi:rubrerythrin
MEKIDQAKIEKIPDLTTSDYTVEKEYRPDMSYAEIIKMAITMEEKALKLYTYLKETADDDLKRIFTFLANEESKHKMRFEKLYAEEISR